MPEPMDHILLQQRVQELEAERTKIIAALNAALPSVGVTEKSDLPGLIGSLAFLWEIDRGRAERLAREAESWKTLAALAIKNEHLYDHLTQVVQSMLRDRRPEHRAACTRRLRKVEDALVPSLFTASYLARRLTGKRPHRPRKEDAR